MRGRVKRRAGDYSRTCEAGPASSTIAVDRVETDLPTGSTCARGVPRTRNRIGSCGPNGTPGRFAGSTPTGDRPSKTCVSGWLYNLRTPATG